ncbi:FAD-dependent oxidoreductase, partial [Streptomyces sp. ZG43]
LRARARSIAPGGEGARWRVETGDETLTADTVVLAVPPAETHDLLPGGALDEPEKLTRIGTAPIINIHVLYDRKVVRRPFFTALDGPVQWVFDRTEASGLDHGQYLALSQSTAQAEIDTPVAELRARYLPELERLLPAARTARVEDFFVTRERTATFAAVPGVGALRPGPATRLPGLHL